jgi:hypothetical protein
MKNEKIKMNNDELKIPEKKKERYARELGRIYKKNKILTVNNVLREAKNKKNPLHDFYEWNDTSAAKKWREHQTRILINTVEIIVENKKIAKYEMIKVEVNNQGCKVIKGYKDYYDIISNQQYKTQIIMQAIAELKCWQAKYENYQNEFRPVFKIINDTERRLNKKKWKNKKLLKKQRK